MKRIKSLLAILLVVLCFGGAFAEKAAVPLVAAVDLDQAGHSLRHAISAFEADAEAGLPDDWTTVDLGTNRSISIGRRNYLLLAAVTEDEAQIVFVGDAGPARAAVERGKQTRVGPLDVILVSATPRSSRAQVLLRAAVGAPVLLEKPVITPSPTKIRGSVEPKELVVESGDARTVAFAREFLRALNEGDNPRDAARRAREIVPAAVVEEQSPRVLPSTSAGRYDGAAVLDDLPENAQITLRVIRGESNALKELLSSLSYDSEGRVPHDPRISGRSGSAGGTVEVGRPGDRFHARLRALESSGKLNVSSESFARVPVGGSSFFSFSGPSGMVSGEFHVQRRGRDRVQVDIRQRSGDWGFLGGVSTSAAFRDGQTIALARSTASRTTSSKSSTPILGQIPIIGPVFGGSRETSESSSYALTATVELE